ncbi:MAG: Autoinducer 2 sensor kinase/phosphatase LuxQ [Ignavibacteria bacterium ADurb.Bin266]|jgi:PAS domain S-box-containing protein|nr:MAG: Autoinducer 2 sensor kinase/phosphatase LuxQ [Ignavibacteria bacterium ADurb.Bin266]
MKSDPEEENITLNNSAKISAEDLMKYKLLYENYPLILFTVSLDKKIISINKNGAAELGYDVNELIGSDVSEIFILTERERIEKQIQYVLMNPGKQSSHEMIMLRKNGQSFWVRETIYTLADTESITEINFVCDNITYQKNAEENAKKLAQSLQNMLDASPLGVLVYRMDENDDLILISTNQSAVDKLKIDVYKLISKKIQDVFPGLLKDNFIEKFKSVIKTGKSLLNMQLKYEDIYLKGVYEFSVMKLTSNTIAVFFNDITEKHNATEALIQSEIKYKTLFESANDAIFLVLDGLVADCNQKTLELFKCTKEMLKDVPPYDLSPEYQLDGSLSRLKGKKKIDDALSGQLQFFEWAHKRFDGSIFIAEISLNRIQLGNSVYVQAIVRDITERKNSERIITEQKRELATLMSNLPGMAYRCKNNINWTMEFVSEGCYQLTGYRQDELINDKHISYASLIHKNDQLLVFEIIQNAVANHEPFTLLYRIITWQGLEKWVWEKGRAIYDDIGNVICLEGFITDITERKLAEEKINILAQTLKNVSECVCITNIRDKIIFVNKSFSRVYGYSQTEIIGKPISFIRSMNTDPAIVKEIHLQTLAGGWTGELINKRKSGEEFPIYLSTSLITDDSGKPIALAAVSMDITEAKLREKELTDAKEKAEQVSRIKSNFFTNVSHELRTPLVGILGFAEILRNEIKNPALADMAETILLGGKRLLETLNTVLDLSRIESDRIEINYSEINLVGFVNENIKLFNTSAEKKNLRLIVKKPKGDIFILADEHLLFQIFNNLMTNAIKYTQSGSVTVEIKSLTKNDLRFASLSIIDTGIGIKTENLKTIFEAFRQVSEGLNRQFEGTGLGLTITKKLVEMMSGEIILKSKFGSGSTFQVIFPLQSAKLKKKDKQEKKKSDKKTKETVSFDSLHKILMVDDDSASRDVAKLFLKNICEMDFAITGKDAISMASTNDYKLILLDINLGSGISGMEVAQKLKNIKGYEKTPIVALTAFALPGEKEEFLNAGCTHYLSKPFSRTDLINLLEELI